MDNGLIFPYPCVRARDESPVLTTQTILDPILLGNDEDLLRGTFGGSSQAMG
jgi:hypothetical protein